MDVSLILFCRLETTSCCRFSRGRSVRSPDPLENGMHRRFPTEICRLIPFDSYQLPMRSARNPWEIITKNSGPDPDGFAWDWLTWKMANDTHVEVYEVCRRSYFSVRGRKRLCLFDLGQQYRCFRIALISSSETASQCQRQRYVSF